MLKISAFSFLLVFMLTTIVYAQNFIMIDPGHGGVVEEGDSDNLKTLKLGSIGTVSGEIVYEKTLTLQYAIALKNNDSWNNYLWLILLTRNDDSFKSLAVRCDMANKENGQTEDATGFPLPDDGADLFLSIHCNGNDDTSAWGTEVYYSNNSTKLSTVRERSILYATSALQHVMHQYATLDNYNERSRWVKKGDFTVIKNTDMPGVLFETDFLTNPTQSAQMVINDYITALTTGLANTLEHLSGFWSSDITDQTSDINTFTNISDQTIVFRNTTTHGTKDDYSPPQSQLINIDAPFHIWQDATIIVDDMVTVALTDGVDLINQTIGEDFKLILGTGASFPEYTSFDDEVIPTSPNTTENSSLDSPGDSEIWELEISEYTYRLEIELESGSNNYNLYGKYGALPTSDDNDWRCVTAGGEEYSEDKPQSGKLYIRVESESGSGDYTIKNIVQDGAPPSGFFRLTVDQQLLDGSRVGQITFWNNWGSQTDPKDVPYWGDFRENPGSPHSTRPEASHNIYEGEKFSNWNNNWSKPKIRQVFVGFNEETNIIAQFNPITNLALYNKAFVLDIDLNNTIQFKDPWYINPDDDLYDDPPWDPCNLGMAAPFEGINSGHVITVSSDRKGVIKDIPYNEVTHYRVESEEIIDAPIHNEAGEWCFIKWAGSNVDFEDEHALESGVEFTGNNPQVKALFKPHLGSVIANPFGESRGCKIRSLDSGEKYLVYQDAGEIYITSSNTTGIWDKEFQVSDGSGLNSSPALTVLEFKDIVCIVWQKGNKIHYRTFYEGNWDEIAELATVSKSSAQPSVGIRPKDVQPPVPPAEGDLPYGLYFIWADYNGIHYKHGSIEAVLLNTDENSTNPVCTQIDDILNAANIAIAWDDGSDIYSLSFNYAQDPSSITPTNLTQSYAGTHTNPTIAHNAGLMKMLVWENNNASEDNVYARYCDFSGNWQGLTNVTIQHHQGVLPSVSADGYGNFTLIWKVEEHDKMAFTEYTNGQGWNLSDIQTFTVPGIQNPTIAGRTVLYSKFASAPYKIEVAELDDIILPSTINSTTNLSGQYYVYNDVTISNSSTVTIGEGTIFYLDPNVSITVESGSKIEANGTADNPIRFVRNYDEHKWDRIRLEGNNNTFDYTVFDGGTYNVDIRSRYNSFSQCTFKNATRGVNAYKRSDGSWSSFDLDNCTIKNNTYGVIANYTYGAINYSDIHNNSQSGLYIYRSRIGKDFSLGGFFTHNSIQDNSTEGIYLGYDGQLWSGHGYTHGYNNITNNGIHEIYLHNSSSTRFYDSFAGGQSSIYDVNGGYYIYNLSKTYSGEYYVAATVTAENNYWGSPSGPSSSNFYGPVDYSPFLSVPPGASSPSSPDGENTINVNEVLSSAGVYVISEKNELTSDSVQILVDMKQKIFSHKNKIRNEPDDPVNARRLNEIFRQLVDIDKKKLSAERRWFFDMVNSYTQRLLFKKPVDPKPRLICETAMLIDIENLVINNESDDALTKIHKYDKYIKNSDNRRDLLSTKLAVLENKRKYSEALAVLQDLKKEVKGNHKYYTAPDYDIIEENLKEELGIKSSNYYLEMYKNSLSEKEINLPEEFAVHNNYPNPFNPFTTIPFSLPQNSHVIIEVYNILGQRVAELSNKSYDAGEYKTIFYGHKLASGMYILRIRIKSLETSAEYNFIRKVVLLK